MESHSAFARLGGGFLGDHLMRAPSLVFDNVTLGYNRHPAVHHLSGEVAPGSLLAVVGPNGTGKSTLLKGIAGELRPMEGEIRLPDSWDGTLAYLPQTPGFDADFPIPVYDFVSMGLWREFGAFRGFSRDARERLDDAIVAVGLGGFESRPVGQLSGGQFQRARFARLILQDASLIVLDEPYNALDEPTACDLAALVRRWHEEGRTIVSVLHDLARVRQEYPLTLLLACERLAYGPTAEVLTEENLARARELMEMRGCAKTAVCPVKPERSH